jgi:hypothetical protein
VSSTLILPASAATRIVVRDELPPLLGVDSDWVSASATRNFCLQDPLLDWLDCFGSARGFLRDDELPRYDPRTDFTQFIFERAHAFEQRVMDELAERFGVIRIASCAADARCRDRLDETLEAMMTGREVIAQGVLWDVATRTFGAADLLVRSDVLHACFPEMLSVEDASIPAPLLCGRPWHYRVVDIKYSTLHLDVSGHASYGEHASYLAQVFIYTRALGSLQGFEPQSGYLLGRSWQQRDERDRGCLERLGRVDRSYSNVRSQVTMSERVAGAVTWQRRLQREGASWDPLAEPTVAELRPNMGNQRDQPWHAAKHEIAQAQSELTLLWQVGVAKRDDALARGVRRSDQPGLSAKQLGVTGSYGAILDRLLAVNNDATGPEVQPKTIGAAESQWRQPKPVEFYVDFETVSDLDDDLSAFPDKGGQPLIFMIGCGHLENGAWQFARFCTGRLTASEEARIIDEWMAYMCQVRLRLAPDGVEPLVFHWSPAETSSLSNAYNAARTRHPDCDWPEPAWFDFLKQVIKAEPVVVRGALGFGLKPIAKALHKLGRIETTWDDGPTDGLGAMVGAWRAAQEAALTGSELGDTELMGEIGRYNEVDCRTMMEVIRYLRLHH